MEIYEACEKMSRYKSIGHTSWTCLNFWIGNV